MSPVTRASSSPASCCAIPLSLPPSFYVRETRGANCIAELFPQFRGWGQAPLRPLSLDSITSSAAGTAFLATPHEVSADLAPALLEAGLRVIDLSGAFRFRSPETFASWYKLPTPHADYLGEAVYGLPELYSDEIAKARLIANPGCYATSVILALRPLAEAGSHRSGPERRLRLQIRRQRRRQRSPPRSALRRS